MNSCSFQYVQISRIRLFFPLRVNHQYSKSRKLFHDSPISSGIQKVWRCQRCSSFQILFLRTLLNHYNSVHKNDINFSVKGDVKSCARNFNKYNLYYKHVRAHHNDIHSLKSIEGITSMGNLEQEQVVFNGNVEFNESEESDDSHDSHTIDDDLQPESEESTESEYEEENTLRIPVSHYTSE